MTTRFCLSELLTTARPGRIARNLLVAGAVFGAGCKKDTPAASPPAPAAAPKTEASPTPEAAPAPAAPTPAPATPEPAAPAPVEPAAPIAAAPVATDTSVLATAPFLALVPKDASMVVAFRAPAALFAAMDEPGVIATLGKPGQDYRDGIKAMFGFSLLDPAAWTAAGLDLQSPVGWVAMSDTGSILTYFGVTDPALATAAIKKMAGDMVWSPGEPTESKVGDATAFTFPSGKFAILLHGKFAITVAGEPEGMLPRLVNLKPDDAMAGGPAVAAAKALGAGKDLGFWVRVPPMLGAANAEHPLILATAFGVQDITGGVDLDAGAIRLKGQVTTTDTSLLKRGMKTGAKSPLLSALTQAPSFYWSFRFDPAVLAEPANYQALNQAFALDHELDGVKQATGLELAVLLKDHLSGELAFSITAPSELPTREKPATPSGVGLHAGVKDEAAVNALLGAFVDKGLLTRGEGAGTYAMAAAGQLPALSITVAGGAVLLGGGPGFAPAGPSFTQTAPAGSGIAAVLGADERLGSLSFDSQLLIDSDRDLGAAPTPDAASPDESEAIKTKRTEIAAARVKAQVASDAVTAADQALSSSLAKIIGVMAFNARVVDGTFVIEGEHDYDGATVAAASKALAEAFTTRMAELNKAHTANVADQEVLSKLEAELEALKAPAAAAAPEAAPEAAPAAPPEPPAAPEAAPDAPK